MQLKNLQFFVILCILKVYLIHSQITRKVTTVSQRTLFVGHVVTPESLDNYKEFLDGFDVNALKDLLISKQPVEQKSHDIEGNLITTTYSLLPDGSIKQIKRKETISEVPLSETTRHGSGSLYPISFSPEQTLSDWRKLYIGNVNRGSSTLDESNVKLPETWNTEFWPKSTNGIESRFNEKDAEWLTETDLNFVSTPAPVPVSPTPKSKSIHVTNLKVEDIPVSGFVKIGKSFDPTLLHPLPHLDSLPGSIDTVLDKLNISQNDIEKKNGELEKTFVENDGRVLTVKLTYGSVKRPDCAGSQKVETPVDSPIK